MPKKKIKKARARKNEYPMELPGISLYVQESREAEALLRKERKELKDRNSSGDHLAKLKSK